MTFQLLPRPLRRMRQPTKGQLRDQLAQALAENARLRSEIDQLRSTWWRRLINRWRTAPKDCT